MIHIGWLIFAAVISPILVGLIVFFIGKKTSSKYELQQNERKVYKALRDGFLQKYLKDEEVNSQNPALKKVFEVIAQDKPVELVQLERALRIM